eukprot:1817319-Alexandrium_andersonii.AAC.1
MGIFENVPSFSAAANGAPFRAFVARLREAGYAATWAVLHPRGSGLMQSRPCLYVLAVDRARV